MKTLRLVIAMLAFATCTVWAQAPIDAEQKVAVRELLDAINFKQVMAQMGGAMTLQMPQMLDQMLDGFLSGGQLTPEQRADARKLAQKSSANMGKQMQEMYSDPEFIQGFEDVMARAYAKYFTTSEIKATTAFYTNASGKKALTIMPQMMQETMPEMMALMAPRMKVMMEKMAKDVVAQVENDKKTKGEAPAK